MSFRRAFQERLKEWIPVGEGVSHKEIQPWEGFESFINNNGERALLWTKGRDRKNLGTLGGGNHFIELQKSTALDGAGEPEGGSKVWLMIHSGSRNMGKRIEEHYHNIARKCVLVIASLCLIRIWRLFRLRRRRGAIILRICFSRFGMRRRIAGG
jgi:tRNA-splicing ligase RtcB